MPQVIVRTSRKDYTLALSRVKRALRSTDFLANTVEIDGEETPTLLVSGFAATGGYRPRFDVVIGDRSWNIRVDFYPHGWKLTFPRDTVQPFREVCGVAWIEIIVDDGIHGPCSWFTEPLAVRLPPGEVANNLRAMSLFVHENGTELFGSDDFLSFHPTSAGAQSDTLTRRIAYFVEACRLYERQFSYFKESAAYQLVPIHTRRSIEALQSVSPAGAQWIVSHPDELQRSVSGRGIRVQNGHWLPRHALMEISQQSHRNMENEAILGFPAFLAAQAQNLAAEIDNARTNELDGFSLAVLGAIYLQGAVRELRRIAKRLRELGELYARHMHMKAPPYRHLPPLTATFRDVGPYRLLYRLMLRWKRLEFPDITALEKRIGSVTSSRLYEYFTLLRLLHDFIGLGFGLTSLTNFSYTGTNATYESNAAAANRNTFVLRKGEERLRLWYQPVLYGAQHPPENGLGLMRTTSWSLNKPLGYGDTLKQVDAVFYTPDFILAYDCGGQTVWAVADSKYSKVSNVLSRQCLEQAFKYLVGLRLTESTSRFAGIWLFCGSSGNDQETDVNFFDQCQGSLGPPWPVMQLMKLNGLNADEKNFARVLLEQMRSALSPVR